MNMRTAAANAIFAIHFLVGFIILFGWMYLPLRPVYLTLLLLWPLCWLLFGFCPLSKWEFQLRGIDTKKTDLNGEIISYYMRKVFGIRIPALYVFGGGAVVLLVSVLGNILYMLRVGHL